MLINNTLSFSRDLDLFSIRSPLRAALAQAKRRAEENYFIIGILEELDDFYYFLDKALPKFFKGIYANYVEQSA